MRKSYIAVAASLIAVGGITASIAGGMWQTLPLVASQASRGNLAAAPRGSPARGVGRGGRGTGPTETSETGQPREGVRGEVRGWPRVHAHPRLARLACAGPREGRTVESRLEKLRTPVRSAGPAR